MLLVTTTHTVNPGITKKLPYDTIRDFVPVALAVSQSDMKSRLLAQGVDIVGAGPRDFDKIFREEVDK